MGRRKRQVHPWQSAQLASTECEARLGQAVFREALELFRAAFVPADPADVYSHRFATPREVTRTVADVISVLERGRGAKFVGSTAALMVVAAGGPSIRSEDHFAKHRKTWDEAIRRARSKERVMSSPHLGEASASSTFEVLAFMDPAPAPKRPLPRETALVAARAELRQMGSALDLMTTGEVLQLFHLLHEARHAAILRKLNA